MFELTETIDIDNKSNIQLGGNDKELGELIKGGFPRIRICDTEFVRKLNEHKPREFSNKNILSIKEIISLKKNEPLFDTITDTPNVIVNGGDFDNRKINGISINSIIGKK